MIDLRALLGISIPLIFSLFISWYASISIIKSSKIKPFFPLLILGILFAYFGAFSFFKASYIVTNVTENLHTSTAFGVSVMVIVLVGVLTLELFSVLREKRPRSLAKAFIVLIFLTGTALTMHVLAVISRSPFKIIITLVAAIAALFWATVILIRFYDLVRRKILYWGIFFGIVATAGFGGMFIWESNIPHIAGTIGINGVIMLLYLLILAFLIDNHKKVGKR